MFTSHHQGSPSLGAAYVLNSDFECNATICYAVGAARQQRFEAYQRALNGFSTQLKFAALKVDGFIGANTVIATRLVGQWMIQNKFDVAAPAGFIPTVAEMRRGPLVQLMASPALTKEIVATNLDDFLPIVESILAFVRAPAGTVLQTLLVDPIVAAVSTVATTVTGGSGTTATTTSPSGATTTTSPSGATTTPSPGRSTSTYSPTPAAAAAAAQAAAAAAAQAAAALQQQQQRRATATPWAWYALGGLAAAAVVGGGYVVLRRNREAAAADTLQPAYGLGRRRRAYRPRTPRGYRVRAPY